MRGEGQLLRIGEYLVGWACKRLPADLREERYREWAGELPAILHDPQVKLALRRAVRMLAYAADTIRGAAMTPLRGRSPARRTTGALYLFPLFASGLITVAWDIWTAVQAPGHGLNYLRLAWGLLLLAYPVSRFARTSERMSTSILASSLLAGTGVQLWNAAQVPGDWVNYLLAACLSALLLPLWIVRRWARTRRS